MFYDWFQGVVADPDSADHYLQLASALVFGLSWLWLIWLLVIQTQRRIFAWLILPVILFMMLMMHQQPQLLYPLGMVAAVGVVLCGGIVARGSLKFTHKIAGGMAVIAGLGLIIVPLVNMQYGARENNDSQIALMGRIAQLDDAHFFMVCQKWQLSCGQPAIPDTGIPASNFDQHGVTRFYAAHGDHQMRVIVDRGHGRMMHDAFMWSAALQRLAVIMIWGLLAVMAIIGHKCVRARGLPHSAKTATQA